MNLRAMTAYDYFDYVFFTMSTNSNLQVRVKKCCKMASLGYVTVKINQTLIPPAKDELAAAGP